MNRRARNGNAPRAPPIEASNESTSKDSKQQQQQPRLLARVLLTRVASCNMASVRNRDMKSRYTFRSDFPEARCVARLLARSLETHTHMPRTLHSSSLTFTWRSATYYTVDPHTRVSYEYLHARCRSVLASLHVASLTLLVRGSLVSQWESPQHLFSPRCFVQGILFMVAVLDAATHDAEEQGSVSGADSRSSCLIALG